MNSFSYFEDAILDCMCNGHIGIAQFLMTKYMGELGRTMSFGARFMEYIATNKFEYTQRQDIHEHVEYPKKRGLLGRGRE